MKEERKRPGHDERREHIRCSGQNQQPFLAELRILESVATGTVHLSSCASIVIEVSSTRRPKLQV